MEKQKFPSLPTELCGVKFRNPIILASGVLSTGAETMVRIAQNGAGAVTTKSCSLEPRTGHKNPTVLATEHFLINAVGLSNPGAQEETKEIAQFKRLCPDTPIIASIFADTIEKFGKTAEIIASAKPHLIEANISCPNVESEFGRPFAASCPDASAVVAEIKKATSIPLIVKLSPNVPNIAEIARAVEAAGANAINAANTLGPGMVIDPECGKPILQNKVGGVSGPAIKPISVRCVYDVSRAVKLPVIGTGGVTVGLDAAEMILAGATAVGVGSAVHFRGPNAPGLIARELEQYAKAHKYKTVADFRALSHK